MFRSTTGQRKHRRAATRWVAAVAGLGVAAGMVCATAPSEAAPADVITEQNLPWNADMEWKDPADWQATVNWDGEGAEPATKCLRGPVDDELGSQNVYQRDYEFFGGDEKQRASALIMDFESNQVADEAYSTLATWATECEATLADKGFTQDGEAQGHLIEIPGTEARFTELTYREHGDDREGAFFEAIGAVRDGNKIALVSMSVWGLDNNWSYEENDDSGLDLHPMYRSMPKVADRLVR